MKLLLLIGIIAFVSCNSNPNNSVSINKEKKSSMSENTNYEYIKTLYGAHSITITVLNHYDLIEFIDDENEFKETQLLEGMRALCKQMNINDEQIKSLKKILYLISEYNANKDIIVSMEVFDSTKTLCQTYVNWIFETFDCFKKDEKGQYYYYPN